MIHGECPPPLPLPPSPTPSLSCSQFTVQFLQHMKSTLKLRNAIVPQAEWVTSVLEVFLYSIRGGCTRWFKYDRYKLWLVYTQSVPVIFEPPCMNAGKFAKGPCVFSLETCCDFDVPVAGLRVQWLLYVPPVVTLNDCVFYRHSILAVPKNATTHSDYLPGCRQHTCVSNRRELCSLWGTNLGFMHMHISCALSW
jgi:hypothetical protein